MAPFAFAAFAAEPDLEAQRHSDPAGFKTQSLLSYGFATYVIVTVSIFLPCPHNYVKHYYAQIAPVPRKFPKWHSAVQQANTCPRFFISLFR